MQMWPLLSQRVGSSGNSSSRCFLQGKGYNFTHTGGAAVEDTRDVLALLLHATQTAHSFTHSSPLIIKSTRFTGPNR